MNRFVAIHLVLYCVAWNRNKVEEDSTFEFTLTVADNENAQDVDKFEVEAKATPLPEPPADTGEICFDIVDNNNNGLRERNVNKLTHSRSNILFFSLISIYYMMLNNG